MVKNKKEKNSEEVFDDTKVIGRHCLSIQEVAWIKKSLDKELKKKRPASGAVSLNNKMSFTLKTFGLIQSS